MVNVVSAIDADFNREIPRGFWDPSRKLLAAIRGYQYWNRAGVLAKVMRKICVVRYRSWSVVTGADIPLTSKLGGGLLIPHPNGIVIHPDSVIGVNCLIHQQVTIGVKRGNSKPPIIGGHVDIGAGAKIIGNISIGEHALIGANAVVTKDVVPYAIVVGVPAEVIGYTNSDG
jgi:serine O-acetyltransferase